MAFGQQGESHSVIRNCSYLVTIPVFDHLVFTHTPEEVSTFLELDLSNSIIVRKE